MLGNFLFKVITNILADRLVVIVSLINSDNQFKFIQGCHIEESIATTLDCVNLLGHSCFGGNMAMEVDTRKAFDAMD